MARRRLGIFRRASSEEEGVEAPAPDSNGDATRDDAATEEHESAPEGTATATEDLGEKEPASDTGVLPAATTDDFSPPHGLFDQETAGVAARSESSDRPEDFQSPDALPPATEPASDTAAEEPTGEWQVLASSEGHGSPVAGGDEDEPGDFAPPDAGGNSPTTVAETPDPFPASVQAEADTEARRSDTAERIRLAAASAAQAAEERAIDEILALEEDLERAKTDASSRVQALEDQVADAQTLEEKARAGAAAWLRSQMKDLNRVIEGFDLRLSEIEERALAAADRVAAAAEELAAEAERLRETADRRVAEETERAQGEANEAADDSISEPEAELDEAEAEAERERTDAVAAVAEATEEAADDEPVADEPAGDEPAHDEPPPEGMVSLNNSSFDELRELGMSVTQAKRVLKFRESDAFTSLDQLDDVPGFSRAFLLQIKDRVVP